LSDIGLQTAAIKVIADTMIEIVSGVVVDGKIAKTFDPPPPKLDTAQLPAFYVFTGNATRIEDDYGNIEITRTYRMQVAFIPIGQGDPYTRETEGRALIDLVTETFSKYSSLGKVKNVQTISVLSDSGIVVLPEWGLRFIGFEVPLQVKYLLKKEYAVGE